jgi:hypothetical protein
MKTALGNSLDCVHEAELFSPHEEKAEGLPGLLPRRSLASALSLQADFLAALEANKSTKSATTSPASHLAQTSRSQRSFLRYPTR